MNCSAGSADSREQEEHASKDLDDAERRVVSKAGHFDHRLRKRRVEVGAGDRHSTDDDQCDGRDPGDDGRDAECSRRGRSARRRRRDDCSIEPRIARIDFNVISTDVRHD
jgi:hypothetical protein